MTTWMTRPNGTAGLRPLFAAGALAGWLLAAALAGGAAAEPVAAPPSQGPAPSPDSVAGEWRSHRPPSGAFELVLTLSLLADGAAELTTADGSSMSWVEKGTWSLQGGRVTVLVFEPGRPPSPNEMVLEPRGDKYIG